jgi:hypothetical protein
MKSSILSEVQNRVSKVPILTKVEKYIDVGNEWILETSGKALDHAHKAAQVIKRSEVEKYFQTDIGLKQYLEQGKNWVLNTSERALNEAYNAALILKKIEDEQFSRTEVAGFSNNGDTASTYFHLVSKKYLLIIEARLLEFRVSNSIIDIPSFSQPTVELKTESRTILDKLKFIDEVLIRYRTQQTNFTSLREDSGFAGRRTPDMSEQQIRKQLSTQRDSQVSDQIGTQWKLMGSLHLPLKKEENSFAPQVVTTVKPASEVHLLQSSSNRKLGTNIGLASMLIVGGFAVGGVTAWAALSAQKPTTPENRDARSPKVLSTRTSEVSLLHGNARPNAPERMPLDLSVLKEKPTVRVTEQATTYQSSEAQDIHLESVQTTSPKSKIVNFSKLEHPHSDLMQKAMTSAMTRPDAPEFLPVEASFSVGKTALDERVRP